MTTQLPNKGQVDFIVRSPECYSELEVALASALLLAYEQNPVYQVLVADAWVDLSKGAMDAQKRVGATVRTLYTNPAPSIPAAVPEDVLTICQRLIKRYVANKGTDSEFIRCVTPERSSIGTGGVWDDWKALDEACRAAMLQAKS